MAPRSPPQYNIETWLDEYMDLVESQQRPRLVDREAGKVLMFGREDERKAW